ncbi:MAG TPA: hypothetical protein P5026_11605 [Kiritimatiellia bacterium]|nr:hypothetical protein [Kiritimatiellia bacterium]HRU71501.1 hypothetical protein [Kiritimatiellia bacterium]
MKATGKEDGMSGRNKGAPPLRRCQCGARPLYRAERGDMRGGRRAPVRERIVCAFCGNATSAGGSRRALRAEWDSAGWCGQAGADPDGAPYGEAWQREMLRKRKPELAALYGHACREREALRAAVRRLRARLERAELAEAVARLERRGVLARAGKGGA